MRIAEPEQQPVAELLDQAGAVVIGDHLAGEGRLGVEDADGGVVARGLGVGREPDEIREQHGARGAFGPRRLSAGVRGEVLALVNARLGAWLPNPVRLDALSDLAPKDEPRSATFRRWPDRPELERRTEAVPQLTYWRREIYGQYSLNDRMILATDGGHDENRGLLELFRRHVTVQLDSRISTEGCLVYGTLALAVDDPLDWDVLEYAQRHPVFPNDGTDRQWIPAEVFAA